METITLTQLLKVAVYKIELSVELVNYPEIVIFSVEKQMKMEQLLFKPQKICYIKK